MSRMHGSSEPSIPPGKPGISGRMHSWYMVMYTALIAAMHKIAPTLHEDINTAVLQYY